MDSGLDIALDSIGVPYIIGVTVSTNFPIENAYQPSLAGDVDMFVAKLAFDGNGLHFSTYLG